MGEPKPAPTLERLIALWNQISEKFQEFDNIGGWEEAMKLGLVSPDDMRNNRELRRIRNKLVHSITFDRKQVEYAVELAEKLLKKLKLSS